MVIPNSGLAVAVCSVSGDNFILRLLKYDNRVKIKEHLQYHMDPTELLGLFATLPCACLQIECCLIMLTSASLCHMRISQVHFQNLLFPISLFICA